MNSGGEAQGADGSLARDGFEFVPGVLTRTECDVLLAAVDRGAERDARRSANRRNLLFDCSEVYDFARSPGVLALLRSRAIGSPCPIRALLFDKTAKANWSVAWHQDQVIPVVRRVEVGGFTAWSVKEGIVHVRAPAAVLEDMITLRLHLDDSPKVNGALRVLPGSHRCGVLSDDQVDAWTSRRPAMVCDASSGDVLLMRPLLLHASPASTRVNHRRVLHVEYAFTELPCGLAWPQSRTHHPA